MVKVFDTCFFRIESKGMIKLARSKVEQVYAGSEYFPIGKTCAVVFTIDDIHPGKSSDAYEAGGDMEAGVLGNLLDLQSNHPELIATVFTTADW